MTSPQKSLGQSTPWSLLLRMLSPESDLSLSAQAASKLSHALDEVNYGRMFNRTNADLDSEPLSSLDESTILPAHINNNNASSSNHSMLISSPVGALSPLCEGLFSPSLYNSVSDFVMPRSQSDAFSVAEDLSNNYPVTSSQLDSLLYSLDQGDSTGENIQSICSLPDSGEMISWLSDEDSNFASSASDVTTDEENLDVKPLSASAIDNHNQQQPAKSALSKRTLDQISTTEEAVSNDDDVSSTNSSQCSKRTRSDCSSFAQAIDSESRYGPCA